MTPPLALDPPVRQALLTVAAHGLPTGGHAAAPAAPLDDHGWRGLLAAVHVERIAGLLDRAVADGALPTTAGQSEDAEAAAAQSLRAVLHLERSLLRVAERLAGDTIPFLVLKGPAVARLDEEHPSLRQYADIDILVRGPDVDAAVTTLASLGYRRDLPERRPGFDRHYGKEVCLAKERGSELDLHRTLVVGAFGLRLDLAAVWGSTTTFCVGGVGLEALDAEGRFVHACLNAVLGDERPRLVALRDVARISTCHALRPERLRALLPPGQGGAVIELATGLARSTLGVEIGPEAAAAGSPPQGWERLSLRAYRARGGSNTLELLSGALGLRGPARLEYLRAVVAPQRAYREARQRAGRPREWRAGLRELLGGHSGPRTARRG
ncbi:MAG: nucleotidyltransferase family protein [Acidimicrobiales bacterium]